MVGITLNPSPADSGFGDKNQSSATHSHYSGNREFTPDKPRKSHDYLKETDGAPNRAENPTDSTVKDVNDMSDEAARKREFQRRHETSTHGDHNKEHFHQTDIENTPEEDTGGTKGDVANRRGTALPHHFGDGVAKDIRKTEGEIY